MKVPQGYKLTEVGILPEDWSVVKLSEVSGISNQTISTSSYKNKDYIGTENMLSNKRGIVPNILNITYNNTKEYKHGDILISNIRPYLKKIWLADKCGCCSNDVLVFRSNALCSSKYLYCILSDDIFFKYVMDSAIGTKMPRGDKKVIMEYQFPIPKMEEQQKIAEALSDVDELIAALDKKIAKKKLIKQAAMQQLLTGKKRLSNYYNSFVKTGLSKLGNFVSGNGFPLQYQGNVVGDYPFYKVSDFNNKGNENHLSLANNYITKGISEKLKCNIIPKNSIIFAKIGAAIFLERKKMCLTDCCIDNNMMSFLPNENIDSSYICYFLQTVLFGELVETTALPSLGIKPLGEVIVNLPSTIKEQQAISKILSDMDEEILDLERKRDKYQLLKSGMMQKLLTGQIRL